MNADLSTMSDEMPKLIGLISKLTLFKQADSRYYCKVLILAIIRVQFKLNYIVLCFSFLHTL